jgi:hypothetical protein
MGEILVYCSPLTELKANRLIDSRSGFGGSRSPARDIGDPVLGSIQLTFYF